MNIPFWKMHGAGNDFVVIDDRELTFPANDHDFIAHLGTRNFGVGSEGIMLIQPSDDTDFRMRFYNPDGGEAEMCGNGARCIARLAHELGVAGPTMTFNTVAGTIGATIDGDQVTVEMTDPFDWTINGSIELLGTTYTYHAVNTGVPHVVIEVDDLENCDIVGLGAAVRYHENFNPNGTNANFIQITGADSLNVRTYERGVEGESMACGTGMVACGILMGKLGKVTAPVKVTCRSNALITINYEDDADSVKNVTMHGPATHVYRGSVDYPSR